MLFFEAFEEIHCDDNEIKNLFGQTEVERVTASRNNNILTIYIKSKRLIHRTNIKKMEELLNRQLFLHTGNKAYIRPLFELSEEYDLDKLFSVYRDSILEELKEISIVTYHLFNQAKIKVQEDAIFIKTKENCVAEDKFTKLKDYLIKLFKERFNYEIRVECQYIKPKEDIKIRLPAFLRSDDEDDEEETQIPQYEFVAEGTYNSNPNNESKFTSNVPNTNNADTSQTSNMNGNLSNISNDVVNGKTSNNRKISRNKASAYNKGKSKFRRLPKDPSVIYGRNFEGNPTPIKDIIGEIGEVVIRGKVRKLEHRPIGNDKSLIVFAFTDFTDSIKVKIYSKTIDVDDILEELKDGCFYMLKGIAMADTYEKDITIGSVVGIKTIEDFTSKRHDLAPVKRVELHAHTMMSDMDAVVDVKKLIRRAFDWGHPAVAITDHGVVQAFPDAGNALNPKSFSDPKDQARAKELKVI
jgi:DNA polymerase-3 subunit alpha (Gram-positive type)